MAVYTVLTREDIESFIAPYGIGPLLSFEAIAAGVENSNYFVTTDQTGFASELGTSKQGRYVLTLFESADADDLDFYIRLTAMLSQGGLPVPCPVRDADGVAKHSLQGKPAALVPRVSGGHVQQPTLEQCQRLGETLAGIHLACLNWQQSHSGPRSLEWLLRTAEQLKPQLDSAELELLVRAAECEKALNALENLPKTVVHGDIFRDNVIFDGTELTAIIDFNSAGDGWLLWDLAVVINDWCCDARGELDDQMTLTLLIGYESRRRLTDDEREGFNACLALAAARFWLSRLASETLASIERSDGTLVELKDPLEYRRKLQSRLQTPFSLKP